MASCIQHGLEARVTGCDPPHHDTVGGVWTLRPGAGARPRAARRRGRSSRPWARRLAAPARARPPRSPNVDLAREHATSSSGWTTRGTTSPRPATGCWTWSRQFRPDVVHLNGYAHGALPWSRADAGRRPLLRPLLVARRSRARPRRRDVGPLPAGGARGPRAAPTSSSRRRRAMLGALRAPLRPAARQPRDPQRPRPRRLCRPRARRSRSSSPPGRLWDEAKNIAALDARRAAAAAGRSTSPATSGIPTAAARSSRGVRPLGKLPPERSPGGSAARRSTPCPRATSRSASPRSRRRSPAVRWSSATSPACARSGATPPSTSRRTTTTALRGRDQRPDRRSRAAAPTWPPRAGERAARYTPERMAGDYVAAYRELLAPALAVGRAERRRPNPHLPGVRPMRIVMFYHSLLSDWNHGNAHFLRGVVAELLVARARRPRLRAAGRLEPAEPPRASTATRRSAQFHAAYPTLPQPASVRSRRRSTSTTRSTAPTSCSSTSGATTTSSARIGRHRAASGGLPPALPRHAPPRRHRAAGDGARTTCRTTTASSRSARCSATSTSTRGWARRAWTWHEAADTRVFRPLAQRPRRGRPRLGRQLGRRRAHRRAARVPARAGQGARPHAPASTASATPSDAQAALTDAGIEYAGWLPNYQAPEVSPRHR